jgi:hypothetical protein
VSPHSPASRRQPQQELVSSEVNLIWNPVPFADVGIEYFHGHRLVLSNLKGDVNGVISRFRVNF